MKKNRQLITVLLLVMTVALLGATFYISALLSSPNNSPTQIQKTKASAITYKTEINLANDFGSDVTPEPTFPTSVSPTTAQAPTAKPTLLALAPTLTPTPTKAPTVAPTKLPTTAPTLIARAPTDIPEPTTPPVSPTLQPLLAYKSTSVSPTLIPIRDTGGMANPTVAVTKIPSPTMKLQPTGVKNLPETGWIQTSSILFIVATTTILFSLIY